VLKYVTHQAFPAGTGHDVAGVVESVGPQVSGFNVGDRVVACTLSASGYADYCILNEKTAGKIPADVSFADAAGMPMAALTAIQALRATNIKPGDSVFISGGAGGVGTFAIQFAKQVFKAGKVTVTCSGSKAELCKSLGADVCVDYTKQPKNYAGLGKFDAVLDVIGDAIPMAVLCKPGSILSSVSVFNSSIAPQAPWFVRRLLDAMGLPATMHAAWNGAKFKCVLMLESVPDMDLINDLVAAGKVKVVKDSVFHGLADYKAAFARAETGRPAGKVVIEM